LPCGSPYGVRLGIPGMKAAIALPVKGQALERRPTFRHPIADVPVVVVELAGLAAVREPRTGGRSMRSAG
jgi:hypothetical protein